MKKNKVIVGLFIAFLILEILIMFVPRLLSDRDINKLNKEISMVNDYIYKDKNNLEDIKKYIKKDVTSNSKHKLELAIDNYLSDILDIYQNVKSLDNNYISDNVEINFTKDDLLNRLDIISNYKNMLYENKSLLLNIDILSYYKSDDQKLMNIYKDLLGKIDKNKLLNRINIFISNLNDKLQIYNYLNDNKDFFDIDNSIIFNKRSKYNEFSNILENVDVNISYELVNDTEGPVINANNIYISEGDYVSINDKVSCIDEVDDNVVCDISGSYNNNVVGTYTINIKSKDTLGNESSKSINVVVKEKEKYNLPYVIEVIRNQSTTIVYERDDNGEYTKIVGVFPCSPGAGTNTPVGTFYSKRGYEWGALFGGVYGQYSTIITGHVLFHSVPYRSMNKDDLKWEYYNMLGSKDSMGCVRLTVRDAKWIYDNCQNGTMIKIYDGELPSGVSKPSAQKIDPNDPKRGWDPTDPDPANPWNN